MSISIADIWFIKGDKNNYVFNSIIFIIVIYLDSNDVYATSGFGEGSAANKKRLDSLRNLRCPRLMSSAAEYYRNRDWKQTVKIYKGDYYVRL